MYLFLGYFDGASQFAQSCGGGGSSSDLPWGRNPDEDDRRFAYRCMMQAHKMLKPTQPKRRDGRKTTPIVLISCLTGIMFLNMFLCNLIVFR